MTKKRILFFQYIILSFCLSGIAACSTQIDNAANRRLQNLSTRYNYIYNAKVLLEKYESQLDQTFKDEYTDILKVYITPPPVNSITDKLAENPDLNEIESKARTIISEKNFSNYIDEAYMLLGKTFFYSGDYYNAVEYFDYVERAYKADKKVYLQALNWKARSYIQLNNEKIAERLLDSALKTLDSVKSGKAEPLATLAQLAINRSDFKKGIQFLEKAVSFSRDTKSKTRWTFILAQLYSLENNNSESLKSYKKVEKSNAAFELYFNAKLNRIKIANGTSSQNQPQIEALLKLIKDDKNLDFIDQIFYEVAEIYRNNNDYLKAEEYYKRSVAQSLSNKTQKGTSYLKLADLNFKDFNNYINAKLYYDSALLTLPKNYPNYEILEKRVENLEYLTSRYAIVNYEDTLQFYAKLPIDIREEKIKTRFINEQTNSDIQSSNQKQNFESSSSTTTSKNSSFYFGNSNALSRGFNDFKKKWGNRTLEINWRQSNKSSNQLAEEQQSTILTNPNASDAFAQQGDNMLDIERKTKDFIASLPTTAPLLETSNQKIFNAQYEIASFYLHVLNDFTEAAELFESIQKRFPKHSQQESINYSLYLAYQKINSSKAEYYKNIILSQYPNSKFAKTILDPKYTDKQNALDLEIKKQYNLIFSFYEKKAFDTVIVKVEEINQRFPNNVLQPQYEYLKAIAVGRTQNLKNLLTQFEYIVKEFPADSLITPLVKEHLKYINGNLSIFESRKIALIDFDENEPRFIVTGNPITPQLPQPVTAAVAPQIITPVNQTSNTSVPPVTTTPSITPDTSKVNPTIKNDGLFTNADAKLYYYVVNVASMEHSVSSSRFGIGQFNRGNYAGNNLKHQLMDLEEDQVIFIGNFSSLNEVYAYSEAIKDQLPKIMKVPAAIYQSFFISKENFDKIKDRATLNRYIEFFKNNY